MKKYVIGVDFGTLSGRTALFDLDDGTEVAVSTLEYARGVMDEYLSGDVKLEAGFALQDPRDYMEVLEKTIPEVMRISGVLPESVVGLGIDFTASTILPVYKDGMPLCNTETYKKEPHAYVKLWKHHGAQRQAELIYEKAKSEEWFQRYGNNVSAEWFFPKILEVLQEREDIYNEADFFVEAGDWIVWQLTGKKVQSLCMSGYKAFWENEIGYPSNQFFQELDPRMGGIIGTKVSGEVVPTGSMVGNLTKEMADKLKLKESTVVSAAIIDAHSALPAAGITQQGKMLMVMGTSSCYIQLDEKKCLIPGICGVVKDGIIPGYYAYEAGQSAVGDIFGWFTKNCIPKTYFEESEDKKVNIHKLLQEKAKLLPPGSNGVLALDWWNGNRSILSDANLSGVLFGLELSTKPEEIYRALLEATAYGARVIVDTFRENGLEINEIYAAGGIPAKNELIIQIYADVLNIPIKVPTKPRSSALGSAIYAAVASGHFESIGAAVDRLVDKDAGYYVPHSGNVAVYEELFSLYKEMHDYFGIKNKEFMKKLKKLYNK